MTLYHSTNRSISSCSDQASFETALFSGIAPDNGLFVPNNIPKFSFDEITLNNSAYTASGSIVYYDKKSWKYNLIFSTGFRAPNLDDVAKVFDSAPGKVIIPNYISRIVPPPGAPIRWGC